MPHTNELWQEYDAAGECLSSGRSSELGNPGLDEKVFVATAQVWLYRKNGDSIEILFQKRSPYVDRNANYFDRSAGGHINFKEDRLAAAIREVKEEIGVTVSPKKLYFIASETSGHANMFIHIYAYDFTDNTEEFHFNDQEVSEVRWIPLSEFDDFIESNAKPALKSDIETNALFKNWLKQHGNN
ncbi:NUDIX domain-containing protein [Candidatus Saccharibacteria bacterium]|nr:NUDIX domain-containing protein [Candidatus Saccharibacteria bacterium]